MGIQLWALIWKIMHIYLIVTKCIHKARAEWWETVQQFGML